VIAGTRSVAKVHECVKGVILSRLSSNSEMATTSFFQVASLLLRLAVLIRVRDDLISPPGETGFGGLPFPLFLQEPANLPPTRTDRNL
jgi:hypothetical protein